MRRSETSETRCSLHRIIDHHLRHIDKYTVHRVLDLRLRQHAGSTVHRILDLRLHQHAESTVHRILDLHLRLLAKSTLHRIVDLPLRRLGRCTVHRFIDPRLRHHARCTIHRTVDLRLRRLRRLRRLARCSLHRIVVHITPPRRGAATRMTITAARGTVASTTPHTMTAPPNAKNTTAAAHLAASATVAGVQHHPTQCTAAAVHRACNNARQYLRTLTHPLVTKSCKGNTPPRSRWHTGLRR